MDAAEGLIDRVADRVRIYEVGPRDGLQNESAPMPTADEARYIELLADAGLREIEATLVRLAGARSRSSPMPMSCSPTLPRDGGVRYPVLVPNLRGLARAEAAGADAIAVFTAATDAFTTRNIRMTSKSPSRHSRRSSRAPASLAGGAGLRLDGLRLPVHGRRRPRSGPSTSPLRLIDLGVDEVCFGDTIGVAVPAEVTELTARAVGGRHPGRADRVPLPRHAGHGARERRRRARRRGPLLRRLDRRNGRLPVCARCGRQSRHRGPRLPARRERDRARRPTR